MGKPLNLPADLIREWAQRQAKASAKLEGRELPKDYVRSEEVNKVLYRLGLEPAPLHERIEMEARWG